MFECTRRKKLRYYCTLRQRATKPFSMVGVKRGVAPEGLPLLHLNRWISTSLLPPPLSSLPPSLMSQQETLRNNNFLPQPPRAKSRTRRASGEGARPRARATAINKPRRHRRRSSTARGSRRGSSCDSGRSSSRCQRYTRQTVKIRRRTWKNTKAPALQGHLR